ncbi:MAG: Omp28-related outer membrane protein [Dysgonamonadaceae bacterium]|jgi:hypothetical protein|nr:Omp28-related outer membrane protein [Dysgonamonadaceae bacterium]
MKKTVLLIFVLMAYVCGKAQSEGNTVSTEPQKRNVLLEEYTGIHCSNCPAGHKIADQLRAKYLGRVNTITVHQGGYAIPGAGEPDFRTPWGEALAGQSQISSYPSGTVNRHVFSNGKAEMGREKWENAIIEILESNSPVNIMASAQFDHATQILTVDVEGYYTANSVQSTNMLNIALLQENVLGPQTGAGTYYPEMMEGGQYRHNHILRDLLTGQWGDSILQTTSGSSFNRLYAYTVPESLNEIPLNPSDMNVVVFIAEGKQEVITATGVEIDHIYHATPTIEILSMEQLLHQTADNNILVKAVVQNISSPTVTSCQLLYGFEGDIPETYSVSGKNLQIWEKDTLLLPLIPVPLKEDKILVLSAAQVNEGSPGKNSSCSLKVKKDMSFTSSRELLLKLWQDKYGSETTWKWFNPDNIQTAQGGPYSNLSGTSPTKLHEISLPAPVDGVYRFEIYDEYGDGINTGVGEGKYEIWTVSGEPVTDDDGKFGKKGIKYISVGQANAVNQADAGIDITVSIRDNLLYITSPEPVKSIIVYNVSGQKVLIRNNIEGGIVPVNLLQSGVYCVKIQTEKGEKTVKAVKSLN